MGLAIGAIGKDMKQPHARKTAKPKHSSELAPQQKEAILKCLKFLKEKNNGDIKGTEAVLIAGGRGPTPRTSKKRNSRCAHYFGGAFRRICGSA